jgi:shikimate dehydrogenase
MGAPLEVYTLDDVRRWPEATRGIEPPLRLAVVGDPVAHSLSPQMHNAALEACGIPMRYTRLHLRAQELEEALRLLGAMGFKGVNVTIPHKVAALRLVDHVNAETQLAGGVNTIRVEGDGSLTGFSTDGAGFQHAVRDAFAMALGEVRVAILGAGGGAGRALAVQCALAGCRRMVLLNRTIEKIRPIAVDLRERSSGCEVVEADMSKEAMAREFPACDLIVNCTPMGMKPADPSPVPPGVLLPRHHLFDTIYTSPETPLMRAGREAGARAANGLGMLFRQGAVAFEKWFPGAAPAEVMWEALQASFQRGKP